MCVCGEGLSKSWTLLLGTISISPTILGPMTGIQISGSIILELHKDIEEQNWILFRYLHHDQTFGNLPPEAHGTSMRLNACIVT